MSIYIGNNKYKEIYLGSTKISDVYLGSNKIFSGGDPYNPLNLPPLTIRVKVKSGYSLTVNNATVTAVTGQADVYDVCTVNGCETDWSSLLYNANQIIEVLGANTTGVTNMYRMFGNCASLTTVPLFDTSSVTNMHMMFTQCYVLSCSIPYFNTSNVKYMGYMFNDCNALTGSIPLFNTSSLTNMNYMFCNCYHIESGALALYQQVSTQATVPTHNTSTFKYCGVSTTTGAAELAQIPSSWGGTAS